MARLCFWSEFVAFVSIMNSAVADDGGRLPRPMAWVSGAPLALEFVRIQAPRFLGISGLVGIRAVRFLDFQKKRFSEKAANKDSAMRVKIISF